MTYRRVAAVRTGPPKLLQIVEDNLHPPSMLEVGVRVWAAVIIRTVVTVRTDRAFRIALTRVSSIM